jgi:hypothetical protein
MKQIGEIEPERSLTPYEDLGGIATRPAKKTPTPSAGLGTAGSTALTTNQPRPQLDEVADILSLARSIKPWQIGPEDQKAATDALKILDYCLIPATYDEAAYWIGRMLAHFPRRDIQGDGVVVADLAGNMVESGVSLIAVAAVTEDAWKAATKKNPWLPPSGEILKDAVDRTKSYQAQADRLRNPRIALAPPAPKERAPSSWDGLAWGEMPVAARSDLWAFLKVLDYGIRKTYCRAVGLDYDTVEVWAMEFLKYAKVENADTKTDTE